MDSANQMPTRKPERGLAKLWGVLAGLGLVAALMAACNGGGDNSPTVQPTGEAPTSPQPTQQATTSAACQALASLDKYRYVSNVSLESPEEFAPSGEGEPTPATTMTREFTGPFLFEYNIDASLVSPDRVSAEMRVGVGEPFNIIIVGDRHWITVGSDWQEVGAQYVVPYRPLEICNAIFPEIDLSQAQGEKESVNGVSALHYTFAGTPSGQAMASIFGPESDMDILFQDMNVEVWVTEKDGWPVKMDIQTSGLYGDRRELTGHLQIELRDISKGDITVEPPI